MSKVRAVFRCSDCGSASPAWVGRCPGCDAWNTLVEERVSAVPTAVGDRRRVLVDQPEPIDQVGVAPVLHRPTGIAELDRVLGGGLVDGSVTLMGGEPGIGKSTLVLQVASALAARGRRVLYVSAEESKPQVRARAERLGALEPELLLSTEAEVPSLLAQLDDTGAELLIVDSIQTVRDPELRAAAGSVGQVRESAAAIVGAAKQRAVPALLVGHVTKEGALAGPRVLEHLVDTVVAFEGDRHHALRLLRASKHRFGSTEELGVFEMTAHGLEAVSDPSRLFLVDRRTDVAGSVVVPALDGYRPLLLEVQALAVDGAGGRPARSVQGLDAGRLAMVLAVLEQRVRFAVTRLDVHALAVGGVRVAEPAADLGVALAVASSVTDQPLPADMVAFGEVGLGGELRQVQQAERRLAEAARLGFTRAIVPRHVPAPPDGIEVLRAATVGEAVAVAGLPLP